jgi:hypothetical protein
MMFDHLKLAIAVVLRPTVYAGTLTDEERAALAAARPFGRPAGGAASVAASAPDRAYASQLSDGLPK